MSDRSSTISLASINLNGEFMKSYKLIQMKRETNENSSSDGVSGDKIVHLAQILDNNEGWRILAEKIGCNYFSRFLEKSNSNPALIVLSYANIQRYNLQTSLICLLNWSRS